MEVVNKNEDISTKDTNVKVLLRQALMLALLKKTAHVTAMMKLQCDHNLN